MTLRQLFNQYKKEYKLKTKLKFDNDFDKAGTYYYNDNIITLNSLKIKDLITKPPIKWVLLHEIKHAIDFTHYKKRGLKEQNEIDIELYSLDAYYHNNLPQEKRANRFANKEFKKIKGEKKYVY